MPKNKVTYLIILSLLFVGLIMIQHSAPKPIDWNYNFRAKATSPYGTFVLWENLPQIFPGRNIHENEFSFYESLPRYRANNNLLIFTDNFEPDIYDMEALNEFVKRGNNVFVSALYFGRVFKDTLKFNTRASGFDTLFFSKTDFKLNLLDPAVHEDSGYQFSRKMIPTRISSFDTLNSNSLGINNLEQINFIKTSKGKGNYFIHIQPLAFTNFHVLHGNNKYAPAALAYLDGQHIIWDKYYKPGKLINTSPTRFILSAPALRTAYYLLITALIFYMLIGSKRYQRKIPVIQPFQNQSLQFIRTTGNLYFSMKNHSDIAKKKITYLKEFLKQRYFLKAIQYTPATIEKLAAKSGVYRDEVQDILTIMKKVEGSEKISPDQLVKIHSRLEEFKNKCM